MKEGRSHSVHDGTVIEVHLCSLRDNDLTPAKITTDENIVQGYLVCQRGIIKCMMLSLYCLTDQNYTRVLIGLVLSNSFTFNWKIMYVDSVNILKNFEETLVALYQG